MFSTDQEYRNFMNQFEDEDDSYEDEINDNDVFSYDDLYDDDDFYEENYDDDYDYEYDEDDDYEHDAAKINYDVQAYEHVCKFKEPE